MMNVLLLSILGFAQATVYLPTLKEEQAMAEDILWQNLINQLRDEYSVAADSYLEKPKEIPVELPIDYDSMDTLNPNPSIRDQEYLRHSSLWSTHQRMLNDIEKMKNRYRVKPGTLKDMMDEKENALPAYCTPPNPCPVGYTSENNCIVDFENTAAFSRDYQSAQDCMCDTEHMLDCSVDSANGNDLRSMHIPNSNFNEIVDEFQQEDDPYFNEEKLPIAAKKGLNVMY